MAGAKLLIPYVTGGYQGWQRAVEAAAAAGADAIEIGIPFSDPVIDGPVIQQASTAALVEGATPASVLEEARALDTGIPHAVMTYYNLCHHQGHERFASALVEAGVSGAILPDLPYVEAGVVARRFRCDRHRGDPAGGPHDARPPSCSDLCGGVSRFRLCRRAARRYRVKRSALASTATQIAARCQAVTDRPVLTGVGIGSPAQAVEACQVSDGAVIGSAVVRTLMSDGPEAVGELVATYRAALDRG